MPSLNKSLPRRSQALLFSHPKTSNWEQALPTVPGKKFGFNTSLSLTFSVTGLTLSFFFYGPCQSRIQQKMESPAVVDTPLFEILILFPAFGQKFPLLESFRGKLFVPGLVALFPLLPIFGMLLLFFFR